jgi:putative ribosome biogenesis GTPase RsgA
MLPKNQESKKSEIGETSILKKQELLSIEVLEKKNVSSNKTIILIGSTGSGKSTLANVLVNEVNEDGQFKNYQEIFKESGTSTSVTKEVEKGGFTESGIDYIAIDTVGIGDTKLKIKEVLDKLAEAVYLAREGISQVLFVIGGRFDEEEIKNYNLLKSIIFDNKVVSRTTVVRTNFKNFEKIDKREEDKKSLLAQTNQTNQVKELSEIINSCNGIIHVDNPSLDLDLDVSKREEKLEKRKITRSKSREILLEHLKKVCQEDIYQPSKLQELSAEILVYMEKKFRKRKELEEKEKKKLEKIQKSKEERTLNKDTTTPELMSITKEDIKNIKEIKEELETELTESENKIRKLEELLENDRSNFKLRTKLRISSLENEIKELTSIKELKEEVQKADEQIRQRIFKHIFKNIDDIAKVTGAKDFLNSFAKDNDDSTSKLSFAELREKREELEEKLSKEGNDQSLEDIKDEIKDKEKKLLVLKKQLLNDKGILEKWQEQGFNLPQAQKWADILKNTFDPENDAPFCAWLRDSKQMAIESLSKEEIESLRSEYKPQQINNKDGEVKTILLIGRTGDGKSALANVLLNKNDDFKEVFEESGGSVSKTKNFQREEFKEDGVKYCIIDTIGFGDTAFSKEYIMEKTKELSHLLKKGVNQILFVIGRKFTEEGISAFNFLKEYVFEKNIGYYTTIVRTRFEDFEDEEECEREKKRMIEEGNEKLSKLIKECNGIICVDNPPIDISSEEKIRKKQKELNIEIRKTSRKILLNHLKNCQDVYKPKNLENLYSEKAIEFLRTKSIFLNARQETIGELKKCFIALENKFGSNEVIGEVGKAVSGAEGLFPRAITFGVPKVIGKAIKASNNFSKIMLTEKGNEEFQLSLKDEQELVQLHEDYDSLIKLISDNKGLESEPEINILNLKNRTRDGKAHAFNTDYEIFDVLDSKNVFKHRSLTLERMEKTINALSENHKELESEWEEQFDKFKTKLGKKRASLFYQEQRIRVKIHELENRLEELISWVKEKLKSKSVLSKNKLQERNKELEKIFKNLPATPKEFIAKLEEIKSELSKKLSGEEVRSLYQVKNELSESQIYLENLLQEQQAQIEQPSK